MRIGFLCMLLIIFSVAWSQEYEVLISNITDEREIDVPATFGIVEDVYGFIWFGTVNGLYRFDGNRMKIFRNIPTDENSLSNNTIRAIVADSIRQLLWIGTQGGGLNSYDLKTGKFTRYEYQTNGQGISNNSIWELMLDKNGMLWIGMENNFLNRFNPETNTFEDVIFDKEILQFKGTCAIRMLYNDRDNNIWVGTDNKGLYRISERGEFLHFMEQSLEASLENNFVLSAYEDDDYFWVATYGAGIAKIDKESGALEHIRSSQNKTKGPISNLTYTLLGGSEEELWVGTEYGLTVLNKADNQAKHYVQNGAIINGLTDNRIRCLFKDSKGIVWVGTEAGVDKLVLQNNFKIYRNYPNVDNSMPSGIVRAITKDSEGNVWVGLIDKGLVKYNPITNVYTNYSQKLRFGKDLICYQISALFEDSQGVLWVGDWDRGLLRFDRKQERFISVVSRDSKGAKLMENRVQVIKEAAPGVLWLGTEMGLHRYDYINHKVDYLLNNSDDDNSLSGNSIQSQAFEIDEKGNLWVGTWSKGLNYIEITGDNPLAYKITRYLQPDNQQWLNSSNVISLHLQNPNTLWVGTFGGGLVKLNIQSGEIVSYDTKDGLPNNTVFAIAEGANNSLWLSTDFGLSNFNPKTLTFENFENSEGLQDNHFFWGAAYTSKDEEQFFGGIGGLNSFYPNDFVLNYTSGDIFLTDLKINSEVYQGEFNPEFLSHLTLEHNQNHLNLGFAVLNYKNENSERVFVRMEGLDDDWFDVGNQRYLHYPNLAPGNYHLEIKTVGTHGQTKVKKSILTIDITPPWWQTWFARIVGIAIIILVVYVSYHLRINLLLNQKKKLTQMVKKQTQEVLKKNVALGQQNEEIRAQKEKLSNKNEELNLALQKLSEVKEKAIQSEKMASIGVLAAGVAHEINNPLNFINGGVMGIESQIKESDCGYSNETKVFLDAIKEGVERTSAIISSLNQFSRDYEGYDDDCHVHAIINNCLVVLGHQLKGRIETTINFHETDIVIQGNAGMLHQVVLNVLSNAEQAISDKGVIEISTTRDNEQVLILLKDSGTGIRKEDINRVVEPFFTTKDPGQGTGMGLSVSYKIIKEHGGEMTFESEIGEGTLVSISLPLKNH